MQVKQVMTRDVEVVDASESIQAAATRMREHDIGVLPVYEDGTAVGMITDRDIAIRGVGDGKAPMTAVRDVMTPKVVCLRDHQGIEDVATLMSNEQVRRALVVDDDQRIVGIVSLGDLAVRAAAVRDDLGRMVLQRVCSEGG